MDFGVNWFAASAFQRRMRTPLSLLLAAALAGCGATSPRQENPGSVAIVASPYEPAAQFDAHGKGSYAEGAVLGAAGGAGIGAMSAKASAGLLCTLGGPLCLIVMVPAAIVGGLVGGVAGAAVDAITTDPGGRIADARGAIEQAVAEMRLTDALAAKTAGQSNLPNLPNLPSGKSADLLLEVGVSELQILAREKDMALVLRARSRLYRASNGEVIDERVSEAQTDFRKYQDWAADEAQPLRRAVDAAIAELSRSIVSAQLEGRPRAGTSARHGG
jgi:ABC-type uncharacterized transport system auxiliary subunit